MQQASWRRASEGREQMRASPAPPIAGDPSAQDARDAYWQSLELGAVERPSGSPVDTFATWLLPVDVSFTRYRVPVKIPVQIARHPTRPSAYPMSGKLEWLGDLLGPERIDHPPWGQTNKLDY